MSDLVSLEKAAELLGFTTKQLNDMRLKNEIFGTRDGAGWKFKLDEVQRFADERNISLQAGALGADSEFLLDDDSLELSFGSADALLEDSDGMVLGSKDELSFGSSDISKTAGSDVLADDEPSGKGSPSDTGRLLADSAELQLSEEDLFDDNISLNDSVGLIDSGELSSDFEDSDLVLEDSDSSEESVFELKGADSGISLSPSDSGISLDEPFSLGGSDIADLELPEDDDIIALEESAGPDSATLLQSDDNFDLTPLDDSGLDDSSGSQVIALEDSAIYTDDSVPTMLGMEDSVDFDENAPVMLEERYGSAMDSGTVMGIPEVPYTVLNILALAATLLMVMLGTMVAFDVVRNLWQPESTNLTDTVANMFIRMLGYQP